MKKILSCVCLFLCSLSFMGFATSPEKETVTLSVIMYHSVTDTKQKSEYILSPSAFSSDIDSLYKDGFSPVFVQDLYDFVDGKGSLPDKPVLITFDDGHYNFVTNVLPVLEKYHCPAVMGVIGVFSERASVAGESHKSYSYLTWEDISLLHRHPLVEIGAHSYDMHSFSPRYGIGRIKNESEEEYKKAFLQDTALLEQKLKKKGITPTVYAYPFGRYNKLAQNILLERGYRITLSCSEGKNIIKKGDPSSLVHLKRYNRNASYSTEEFLQKIG